MKSEILHRAWVRQSSSRWSKSAGKSYKMRSSSFIYYKQAMRNIKKRGRLLDLRIEQGVRRGIKGKYRHIHALVMGPLLYARRKSKLIHCDWAAIPRKQAKPVKLQELEGLRWIDQNRWED